MSSTILLYAEWIITADNYIVPKLFHLRIIESDCTWKCSTTSIILVVGLLILYYLVCKGVRKEKLDIHSY